MTIENENRLLITPQTRELIEKFMPDSGTLGTLAEYFFALSDSTRLKILSALSISPMCVGDISTTLGINQTTVSHQLRTLRLAGIVRCRRQGKIGFYRIADKNVLDVMLSATDGILATRAS